MRAPRKNPLQQWQAIRANESLIAQKIEQGYALNQILAKVGITPYYYQRYRNAKLNTQVLK